MGEQDRYQDRRDAGRQLAERLRDLLPGDHEMVVLGLPRGGIPVAYEVARALNAPLDAFTVRKLGMPGHEELAIGAIATGGARVLNTTIVQSYGVSERTIERAVERERIELERRERLYRDGRPPVHVRGRLCVLVDDGLATGASMRAAVAAVRQLGPRSVYVAVPVASRESCEAFRELVDDVCCPLTPEPFFAVGQWYEDFAPTSDQEVRELLRREQLGRGGNEREATIPIADGTLRGTLTLPRGASALVLFAHGSGSSRHSPRNRFVAHVLHEAGLATLLMDLLTEEEERAERSTGHLRFDVEMLAERLAAATHWSAHEPALRDAKMGYFGASTGAAAAIVAAAAEHRPVHAIVSRGGRPDLAGDRLARVRAPTLLIVGGQDHQVIELNRKAKERMTAPVELTIVPGASHLFEEPGTLEQVAGLARDWFVRHLVAVSPG